MPKQIAASELANYVGQEIGVSDWVEVDQKRIDLFAEATGDHQWIHVDVERANAERGGTIAHGYLIVSLLPILHESILEITGLEMALNYGVNKVRFTGQVRAGSKIRLRERLLSVEPKSQGLLATYDFKVELEGAERPVCVAEALGLIVPAGAE